MSSDEETDDLDAYQRLRAPADAQTQAVAAFESRRASRKANSPGVVEFPRSLLVPAAAVVLVVLASGVYLLQSGGSPEQGAPPGPAALSLGQLSMPVRPDGPNLSPAQLKIPKLNQISVNFDVDVPEEVL